MLTTDTMQDAMEAYRTGASLVEQERFKEAIPFLSRAADVFRKHDAEGHPAEHTLENGVSALANALSRLGVCSERTGDISRAISFFETAYIHERFESRSAFRSFAQDISSRLVSCYEQQMDASALRRIDPLPVGEPVIDSAYRFPFSLDPQLIPLARLYELAPHRYGHLRTFYGEAKRQDSIQRRAGSRGDDRSMRKISVGVWSVIAVIWIVYGIVVIRALMHAH